MKKVMVIVKTKQTKVICASPDCLAEAVFASPIDYGDYCRFHWTEKKKFWKGIWPPIKTKDYSRKDIILTP